MSLDLPQIVRQTMQAHGMLEPAQRALVAVSGGADSMALLHLLHRAGLAGAVAHFDHQTREGASAEDAAFVARAAEALGLPCFTESQPIEAMAAARKESFEMVAREARYAFFRDTAVANGFDALATGHHADDQAETVLLRLLRGASPAGLAGIPPIRDLGGVRVIRPLLDCSRAQLVDWLEVEGIAWREDASNKDARYERNQLRHELIPRLERDYNPAVVDALSRLARLQRMDDGLLSHYTEEALTRCLDREKRLQREPFIALEPALQYRCMVRCIQEAGGRSDYESVARAVAAAVSGDAGAQVDLGNGAALYLAGRHAVFAPLAPPDLEEDIILPIPGETSGFGRIFRARRLDRLPEGPLALYCHARRQVFDGAALGATFTIRRRRPGDRFQPLGMAGAKKVKDVFNDLGLTRPERDAQVMIESGGEIVWIVGHTVSGGAALKADSAHCVELTVTEADVPDPYRGATALSVGGPVLDSKVSLCIYKDDIDIEGLTAMLGVSPTTSRRRGDIVGKRRPVPLGRWELEPPDGLDFEGKLAYLTDTTPTNPKVWDAIIQEHSIQLRCAVFLSSWTESFDLSEEWIAEAGRRHWNFSLSMYSADGNEILDAFLRNVPIFDGNLTEEKE